MTANHMLIAYIATLVAIVILVGMGVWASATGHSIEAVGVGAAVTGLIGVIKSPSQTTSTVNQADTVNQGIQP
jgi:hypothetical protein